jgi:hypothetical protein
MNKIVNKIFCVFEKLKGGAIPKASENIIYILILLNINK